MNCPICGAENPAASAFCNLCLYKFAAPSVPEYIPPVAPPPSEPPAYHESPAAGPVDVGAQLPADAPSAPPPPWATGAVYHDPNSHASIATPDGRAVPDAALESSDFWQMQFAVDPKVKELREKAKPKAPIDKLRALYPKDQTWYGLYGFAVAVAVAGAVFFRIAAEFFIRMFLISTIATAPLTGTHSEVATSSRLSITGIVFGSLIVIGVIFALCYMVGFRSRRLGAAMGAITASHLVVFEGIILLITVSSIANRLNAVGGRSPLNWVHLVIGLAVLVPIGAGAGWVGENVAVNRTFGNWSFNKLLTAVAGGMAVILFLVGVGGLIKGAVSKPSSAGLNKAFASMREMSGWQADVSGRMDKGTITYEKGKGYRLSTHSDTWVVALDGKSYEWDRYDDEWDPGKTRDPDFFDNDAANVLVVTKKSVEARGGKQCNHYQVEIESMRPFSLLSEYRYDSVFGGVDADIWTDILDSSILEFDFQDRVDGTSIVFSRFGEPVFGAEGIWATPGSERKTVTSSWSLEPSTSTTRDTTIYTMEPTSGSNDGAVTVELTGRGLSGGSVKLVMEGQSDIMGSVLSQSDTKLSVKFNIKGKKAGKWYLTLNQNPLAVFIVTEPSGSTSTTPSADNPSHY